MDVRLISGSILNISICNAQARCGGTPEAASGGETFPQNVPYNFLVWGDRYNYSITDWIMRPIYLGREFMRTELALVTAKLSRHD